MIKVSIRNKQSQQITHQAQFKTQVEVDTWIEQCEAASAWGKVDRWVRAEDQEDISQATDTREVILYPALEEIIDEETQEVIQEAQEAGLVTEYFLPAEYIIEQVDITVQLEQEKVNQEALAYLASTDWMVIREAEGGTPCPEEVKVARQAARDRIVR